MNPDEAAGTALLHPSRPLTRAPGVGRLRMPRLLARVLRAWMEGWTWYARQGFAPASVEPVFPLRAAVPGAAAPRSRWTAPCPPPRFALLYGRGAGAGCP
jgi:hypothetical protein